jgi:hypothetical protein
MEKKLADHFRRMDSLFYGLTRKQARQLAYHFAELNNIEHKFNKESKEAGKKWFRCFCARQKLTLRTPEKLSACRASSFNKPLVNIFFKNLKELYEKYHFQPQNIYNMDESGISVVPHRLQKTVSPLGKKIVQKVVAGEKGETATIVVCMNVTGFPVPPALIIPRVRLHEKYYVNAPTGTLKLHNSTGYMTSELFLDWIKHFCAYAKPSELQPVLLIMDNHVSHINLEAIEFCRAHNIHLLTLPPHTTHVLQPLDIAFFGPFKTAYSTFLTNFPIGKEEYTVVKLENIAEIFRDAFNATATISNAEAGFRGTGIFPFKPDKFTETHFMPSNVTDGRFQQVMIFLRKIHLQAHIIELRAFYLPIKQILKLFSIRETHLIFPVS